MLYTEDGKEKKTAFNLMGASGNVISTLRYDGKYAGKYYTYNKDIRTSTTNITDDAGNYVTSYDYTEYGETTKAGDTAFYNEINYTGGIFDESTGLYYLNARYYDPQDSRFLSQDTYRGENTDPATLNLYGYCAGNPINFVDPSGHKAKSLEREYLPFHKSKSTSPLDITIKGNRVKIIWRCYFDGDSVDKKVHGSTFRKLFTYGITSKWSGTYKIKGVKNVIVSTSIEDKTDDKGHISRKGQEWSRINFKNKAGRSYVSWAWGWNRNRPGSMKLYPIRKKSTSVRSAESLRTMAAHEFGHILGIKDGYNNKKTKKYNSIMCDPYGDYNGTGKATAQDIKKALDAFKKNKTQKWK